MAACRHCDDPSDISEEPFLGVHRGWFRAGGYVVCQMSVLCSPSAKEKLRFSALMWQVEGLQMRPLGQQCGQQCGLQLLAVLG